ncbi:MAG: polysaccharide export protein [Proteobacteria bacterium]|nr:polysaccharide export protein [Pseudomonadota bacterium]
MTARTFSTFALAVAAALLATAPSLAGDRYPPVPSNAADNTQAYPFDTVPVANPPIFRNQADIAAPPPAPPVSTPPPDNPVTAQPLIAQAANQPVADAPPRSLNARNSDTSRERTLELQTADVQPRRLAPPRLTPSLPDYKLGTGDKIRIVVYGEDDLGGEFEVDGSGFVRLPLIGQVQAAGFTIRDLETQVTAQLADGYVNSPRVSADIVAYRPFFIIGEVNHPGQYPYQNDMNLLTAVALAGGYTYRADDSDIYIRRNGSIEEKEYPADATTKIQPGDIIRISERFF